MYETKIFETSLKALCAKNKELFKEVRKRIFFTKKVGKEIVF